MIAATAFSHGQHGKYADLSERLLLSNFCYHIDCLRKNYPLRLLHDAALENLRRVAWFHLNCLLKQDWACIRSFIYIMNRCPRHFYSPRSKAAS